MDRDRSRQPANRNC